MKEITLTKGYQSIVDEKHYLILNKHKWCVEICGKSRLPYAVKNVLRKSNLKMHRYIMQIEGFDIKNKQVDHINGNTLDNRLDNLRLCSHSENMRNSKKRENNTSGYKGVSWYKRDNKWKAQISLNGKNRHIGYFDSKIDAAKAYNDAALKFHGKFARINII